MHQPVNEYVDSWFSFFWNTGKFHSCCVIILEVIFIRNAWEMGESSSHTRWSWPRASSVRWRCLWTIKGVKGRQAFRAGLSVQVCVKVQRVCPCKSASAVSLFLACTQIWVCHGTVRRDESSCLLLKTFSFVRRCKRAFWLGRLLRWNECSCNNLV